MWCIIAGFEGTCSKGITVLVRRWVSYPGVLWMLKERFPSWWWSLSATTICIFIIVRAIISGSNLYATRLSLNLMRNLWEQKNTTEQYLCVADWLLLHVVVRPRLTQGWWKLAVKAACSIYFFFAVSSNLIKKWVSVSLSAKLCRDVWHQR